METILQTILDLVFENIIFVFVILGMLSSLLAKLRKVRNEGEKGGNTMPPFGGGPSGWPVGSPSRPQVEQPHRQVGGEQTVTVRESDRMTDEPRTDHVFEGENSRQSLPDRLEVQRDLYSRPVPQSLSSRNISNMNMGNMGGIPSLSADRLTASELVKGMILSEVFSAPRAKRPYTFRK